MLPAATVRTLTIPSLIRKQTWIATIVFSAIGLMIAFSASHCVSSESGASEKGRFKSKNGGQTTSEARDAQPPQRAGPFRRFR